MNMKGKQILLVEDDKNFGDVLKSYLEMNGFDITLVDDGEKGFNAYRKQKYDLCIFDVMMPKKDGFTLAKEIRETDRQTPIIFLTAKTLKEDVVNGFKIGADDYISKPFDTTELLYRVQAILKRSQAIKIEHDDRKEFNIGSFHFNYPLRILSRGESKEKLSPKEAELLRMFSTHMNDILPRSTALREIWGEDNYFTARSMDVFVTKLRKYLKEDPNIEIVNIHGNGFQLLVQGAKVDQ